MAPAVVVVIFTVLEGRLSVLLIERAAEPCQGEWALPGGLLQANETLDGAASRKLQDETGLTDVFLEQLYSFDATDEGDAGIVVAYFALLPAAQARLRRELEWRPAWHALRDLDALAFGNEGILDYARERLRNKLAYTNVAYSFLPRRFTLAGAAGRLRGRSSRSRSTSGTSAAGWSGWASCGRPTKPARKAPTAPPAFTSFLNFWVGSVQAGGTGLVENRGTGGRIGTTRAATTPRGGCFVEHVASTRMSR